MRTALQSLMNIWGKYEIYTVTLCAHSVSISFISFLVYSQSSTLTSGFLILSLFLLQCSNLKTFRSETWE